jgi:hypothetical protein
MVELLLAEHVTRHVTLLVVTPVVVLVTSLVFRRKAAQNASKETSSSNMGILELAPGDKPIVELVFHFLNLCQL